MAGEVVRIEGLAEYRNQIRRAQPGAQKHLQKRFKALAQEIAAKAGAKVPMLSGKARASVRARATQTTAMVVGGGDRVPYFPWLDFGGSTGRNHVQGQAGSGSVKRPWLGKPSGDGRYIWKTIGEEHRTIEDAAREALKESLEEVGLTVHG